MPYRFDLSLTDLTMEEANLVTEGLALAKRQLQDVAESCLTAPGANAGAIETATALVERVEEAWAGRIAQE